jgi:hypothetical protein
VTGRERLMSTLRGEAVDRPAVSFYEIGGFDVNPADGDRFNIYNSPSWQPLLRLAEDETDLIRMRAPERRPAPHNDAAEFFKTDTWEEGDSRFTRTTLKVGGRTMTALSRRDAGLDTTWEVEHLIKDVDDLKAYLALPASIEDCDVDVSKMIAEDATLGDRGIVMVDVGDPICQAASLFSMADYTVAALTEPELFHRLLARFARPIMERTESVAREFPGHLWRIFGPEYATPPYLPPRLFDEYVVRYTGPMVEAVQRYGGFARIHCHGRIKDVMPLIMKMHPSGIDPIEPPHQGDVELSWMRREYGRDLVLFGNIEASDIENLTFPAFESKCRRTILDGTTGQGMGFVLMPSACPYGREIQETTMANYRTMVRLVKQMLA